VNHILVPHVDGPVLVPAGPEDLDQVPGLRTAPLLGDNETVRLYGPTCGEHLGADPAQILASCF